MRALKLIILIVIACLPFHYFRRFLYRKILGFKLAPTSKIDMFNLLDIQELCMDEQSHIRGFGNIFLSVHRAEFAPYSRIGGPRVGLNLFRGTANKENYPPARFQLGPCSIIELFHYFDLCSDIIIGSNVVVGGIKSVFFTHTLYKPEFKPIHIKDDTYIGSNCLFQMDVSIPPRCVLGLGSVIVDRFEDENTFIAGVPAKIVRKDYGYNAREAFCMRGLYYWDGVNFLSPHNNETPL